MLFEVLTHALPRNFLMAEEFIEEAIEKGEGKGGKGEGGVMWLGWARLFM